MTLIEVVVLARSGLEVLVLERETAFRGVAANPAASPVASAFLGAWVLPEEAYSDAAWEALVSA